MRVPPERQAPSRRKQRLKLILPIAVVLCSAIPAYAQPLSAQQLLDDVVAQLPREPLLIRGDLTVRKRRGIDTRKLKFEMSVNWGSSPAVARYTILDPSGTELEQLTVSRSEGREPLLEYAAGSPLTAFDTPDLFQHIQGTDVSWADLTLSFLWWRGGSIVRTDEVRGRECYVIEVPAPQRVTPNSARDSAKYSRALLWIDKKLHMLLRAEAYDSRNKLMRRLWVKSLKKIGDRWMIKDMEIQGFPPIHRTKLSIKEVSVNTQL